MGVHELAGIFNRLGKLRIVRRKPETPVRLTHGKKLIALLDAHLLEEALRQNHAAGVSDLADLEGLGHDVSELEQRLCVITCVITTVRGRIGFEVRTNTSPSAQLMEARSVRFRRSADAFTPDSCAMTSTSLRRVLSRILIGCAALVVPLVLAGCSGDDTESSTSQQQSTQSPQEQGRSQQGQTGQMPEPGASQMLSSSDVSDEQLQTAARIAMSVQMGMQEDRAQMRKDMKQKYGNPQQMDSTQKRKAQKEMRRRQLEMRKKQMSLMQEEAENEDMDPKTFRQIMRSAQQDSTLQRRLQKAMKAQMKKQQPQMNQSPNP